MGSEISGGHYANNACWDGSAPPDEQDQSISDECQRQEAEFLIADGVCVGSALWTVGSLPSVLGAVGGGIVTIASCAYAGLKADDRDAACGIEPPPPPDPMAMDRPMDQR